MTSAGIVFNGDAGRWWAWAALRLAPADPGQGQPAPVSAGTTHNAFDGTATNVVQAHSIDAVYFHEPAAPDDRPWLSALWDLAEAAKAVVELRHLRTDHLETFLVVRTEGADHQAALGVAERLRHDLLVALPPRLAGEPVTADRELREILEPFRPDPAGLVEIRKTLTVARTTRGGDGPWLAAVTPWRRGDGRVLGQTLAALHFRAALSVGLAPYRIGPGLRRHLAGRGDLLTMLSVPGPSLTHSVFGGPQPPDQFAVHAHPLLAEAVGRYTGRAFRVRVSLAAERPLSDHLATTVAESISPRLAGGGMAGAPAVAVRPSADELETAWRNITGLDFTALPTAHLQGCAPDAVGDVERTLGSIVDIDEAAAAFRFPDATWRS